NNDQPRQHICNVVAGPECEHGGLPRRDRFRARHPRKRGRGGRGKHDYDVRTATAVSCCLLHARTPSSSVGLDGPSVTYAASRSWSCAAVGGHSPPSTCSSDSMPTSTSRGLEPSGGPRIPA